MRRHENYKELVWMLAKTDFKLRYQGSVLGYLWAILKPLLMFLVLNFVFSSLFNSRGLGVAHYSLQLLVAIILFNFFSEGTLAGMNSLLSKSQLVTKIYVPRWTIIAASTVNSALIFLMNVLVIVAFFAAEKFVPSFSAILLFAIFSIFTYVVILSFSLLSAPLFVKFRDLAMIWEVALTILFYATPIFYSLQMMPIWVQKIMLLSPIAFVIHFSKEALINNHFADFWKTLTFLVTVTVFFVLSVVSYRKFAPRVAENI